jgi:2-polyprenyl-3-methyl-5-hydroxy-6-metoxy-1,4-benzoquinol methylase
VTGKSETQRLAERYNAEGDPTGWFDEIYRNADGDINRVVWADLVANPCLVDWLAQNRAPGPRAAVVGCGLGDDVEYLHLKGFDVTGFDISSTAISMCRERFAELAGLEQLSLVEYNDEQQPPAPHFFACYRRPSG